MSPRSLFGVFAVIVATSSIYGQVATAPVDPFGRIFTARVRPEVQRINIAKFAALPSASFMFAGIGIGDSEAASSGSLTFGYGGPVKGRDLLLSATYSHVNPDHGEVADRAAAYAELVLAQKGFGTVSGVVTSAYDPGAFKTYGVVLVAERDVVAGRLTATANLGWAEIDPDGGSSIRDVQPALGLALAPDARKRWMLSADYTFKNDVDGEDSASFVVSRSLPRIKTKIKAVAAKHRAYSLSLTRVF